MGKKPLNRKPTPVASRREFTDEFKREAVQMPLDGHKAGSIAERLGLSRTNMLYRWRCGTRSLRETRGPQIRNAPAARGAASEIESRSAAAAFAGGRTSARDEDSCVAERRFGSAAASNGAAHPSGSNLTSVTPCQAPRRQRGSKKTLRHVIEPQPK